MVTVQEGSEPADFWAPLGGKAEYPGHFEYKKVLLLLDPMKAPAALMRSAGEALRG